MFEKSVETDRRRNVSGIYDSRHCYSWRQVCAGSLRRSTLNGDGGGGESLLRKNALAGSIEGLYPVKGSSALERRSRSTDDADRGRSRVRFFGGLRRVFANGLRAGVGFLGPEIASSLVRSVAAECSFAARPVRLLVDVTRLLPQRDEGQAAFGDLMTSVTMLGEASVAVVFSNMITKMQLLRLAKERGARNWAYFSSNSEAMAALARAQQPRR
jgi:hypothetical protein